MPRRFSTPPVEVAALGILNRATPQWILGSSPTRTCKPQCSVLDRTFFDLPVFLAPFSWGTQKREAAAPKASGCFVGGKQEIFGAVSKDLLGGAGKAEAAKLPDAGISLKQCPGK